MFFTRYLLLLIVAFSSLSSCGIYKKNQSPFKPTECFRKDLAVMTRVEYESEDNNLLQIIEDFNLPSDKDIDVLRILQCRDCFDNRENVKRIYIKNNTLYILKNHTEVAYPQTQLNKIKLLFKDVDQVNTGIICSTYETQRCRYYYFVRIGGVLVMNISVFNKLENIDPALLENEIKYIKAFEDL